MNWIFLSPHFDDAAYSCGGLIWELAQAGEPVEIWTVCAGEPGARLSPFAAQLHARWGGAPQAVAVRRQEDQEACQILNAAQRLFDIPDCIYRVLPDGSPLIVNNEDLFTAPLAAEAGLVDWLAVRLRETLPFAARVVAPLALGGHVDHRLVRAAAESSGAALRYYADFPYVAREKVDLTQWVQPGWQVCEYPVSERGLLAWQRAVAAYRSQVSSFWPDETALYADMEAYWKRNNRLARLWGPGNGV